MKDIANRLNISVTTVSKVINNHPDISEKTRIDVMKTIEEMGYVPNIMAANLRRNKGNMVGLVLSDISKPYFSRVIHGYESTLNAAGYHTLIFNSMEQADREIQLLKQISSINLAGIIIDPAQNSRSQSILKQIGIPYVFSNRFFNADTDYYVAADNKKVGYIATMHLISRKPGYPIICINGPDAISPTILRYAGFKKAIIESGIFLDEQYIYHDHYDFQDAYRTGKKIATRLSPPFSVFCSTDLIAIGVLRALYDCGIKVPEDVGVIGVDDIEMASYLTPALSTVSLPKELIGEMSAKILISKMIGQPINVPRCLLEPKLVIRETT